MDWPNDIAGQLPAPRDDEPDSLRDDIVDELADHLTCALNRELHATSNETDAERNVLERFGNPRRIARRLWFDAMKEKIMSQRLQMVQTVVMAVICLAVLGLTWTIFSQNRALTEVNRAVLEQLTAMSGRPSVASQSPEWIHAKVRLALGEPGGPPAVGFGGQLQGNLWGSTLANLDR